MDKLLQPKMKMKSFSQQIKVYGIILLALKAKRRLRKPRHFLLNGHLVKFLKIRNFLRLPVACLQVGGGKHKILRDNWLNADLIDGDIFIDAEKKLPFPSSSLDCIFAEQFIEHLSQKGANQFIQESYRTLKKGGCLRLATPDLEKLVLVYLDRNKLVSQKDVIKRHLANHRIDHPNFIRNSKGQFFNDIFRLWGHKHIYDYSDLKAILLEAGFVEVRQCKFGVSENYLLNGLERHADVEWMKDGFNLIVEANKN